MRVLFTGASSFTGFWFIEALKEAGHEVVALFRKEINSYSGVRGKRVEALQKSVDCRFSTTISAISDEQFDLLSLHGAHVENYKSEEFDPLHALTENTRDLKPFLQENRVKRVVVTSTCFEGISPYGLSKKWSAEWVEYLAKKGNISYGKFVIPNPFGPFEEEKFTTWLVKEWKRGQTPLVKTPLYVRDNIAVTLLAKSYLKFAFSTDAEVAPSGYVGTQEEFVARFAKEIGGRLSLHCPYTLAKEQEFVEPAVLINRHPHSLPWDEKEFWDTLATYYATL